MLLIAWTEIGKSVDGVSGFEVVVSCGVVPPILEPAAEAEEEATEGFAEPSTHASVTVEREDQAEGVWERD